MPRTSARSGRRHTQRHDHGGHGASLIHTYSSLIRFTRSASRMKSPFTSRRHSPARAPSRVSTEMQSIGRRLPHRGTSSCEMQLSPCETASSRTRSAYTLSARMWVRSTTPDCKAARSFAETSRHHELRSTVAEPDAAGPTGMSPPNQRLIARSPLK